MSLRRRICPEQVHCLSSFVRNGWEGTCPLSQTVWLGLVAIFRPTITKFVYILNTKISPSIAYSTQSKFLGKIPQSYHLQPAPGQFARLIPSLIIQ